MFTAYLVNICVPGELSSLSTHFGPRMAMPSLRFFTFVQRSTSGLANTLAARRTLCRCMFAWSEIACSPKLSLHPTVGDRSDKADGHCRPTWCAPPRPRGASCPRITSQSAVLPATFQVVRPFGSLLWPSRCPRIFRGDEKSSSTACTSPRTLRRAALLAGPIRL